MDGTLYKYDVRRGSALVLFDTVPGGPDTLSVLASTYPRCSPRAAGRRALRVWRGIVVLRLLRTYSNQIWHEQLVRGLAADVLGSCS